MTAGLLLLGLVWLVAGYRVAASPARRHAPVLAVLGPLSALGLFLLAYQEAGVATNELIGKVRVAVTAVTIPFDADNPRITICGDPDICDIVIPDAPLTSLTRSADDKATRISTRAGADWKVSYRTGDETDRPNVMLGEGESGVVDDGTNVTLDMDNRLIAGKSPEWTLHLIAAGHQAQLHFDTPELVMVPGGRVEPITAARKSASGASEFAVPLESIGAPFASTLEDVELLLPEARETRTFVGGYKSNWRRNEHVDIVGRDGRSVILSVNPISLSVGLRSWVPTMLGLVLVANLLVGWRLRSGLPIAAILFGAAEILLSLRLLIAVEGGMIEEKARVAGALAETLVALPMTLLILSLAMQPLRRAVPAVAVNALLIGASLRLIHAMTGGIADSIIWSLALLASVAALVALVSQKRIWLQARWLAFQRLVKAWLARLRAPDSDTLHLVAIAFAGALLLLALRLAAHAIGFDEKVQIAGKEARISLFFVPATLLVAAPLLCALSRARAQSALLVALAGFGGFLLFGVFAPNLVVSGDFGLGLVLTLTLVVAMGVALLVREKTVPHGAWLWAIAMGWSLVAAVQGWADRESGWWLPPVLVLLLLAVRAWRGRRDVGLRSELLTGIGLAPLLVFGMMTVVIADAQSAGCPAPVKVSAPVDNGGVCPVQLAPLDDSLLATRWQVRLIGAFSPDHMAQLISGEAVRLRNAIDHLRSYSSALEGRGYLNVPPPTELRVQQFTDYGAAIHVIAPFGLLGAAGLIGFLGGIAIAVFGPILRGARGMADWLGALGLLMIAATSSYIILGNALLTPFTGRNIYLLAVDSTSDLFEGLLLLVLGALFLTRKEAR